MQTISASEITQLVTMLLVTGSGPMLNNFSAAAPPEASALGIPAVTNTAPNTARVLRKIEDGRITAWLGVPEKETVLQQRFYAVNSRRHPSPRISLTATTDIATLVCVKIPKVQQAHPLPMPAPARYKTDLFATFVLALTLGAVASQFVLVIWLGSR